MSNNKKLLENSSLIHKCEEKLGFFVNNPIIALVIIGLISFLIRLFIFESELPIRQDANAYFWYAMDMSILNYFPHSVHANDGWPMTLSIIFSVFSYDNYLDYTIVQRVTTITISVLTIIPIYYFCKKFFQVSYCIVGVALFAFEPHLIQNSTLGLTEPLYIFLGISALSLFLTKNEKLIYCSFAIIAITTLVRSEGVILFSIMLILFFIFNNRDRKTIAKFFVSIAIFVIIFGSMTFIKADTSGGIEDTAAANIGNWAQNTVNVQGDGISVEGIFKGVETLIKRLAQSMIPYFALFVPFGIILAFKDKNKNKFLILISLLIFLVASVRIYTIVGDLRLIFILYPFLVIFSIYTIQYLIQKSELKKMILLLIIGSCLILSGYFLYSNLDSDYEKEANNFAKYMVNNVSVSNNFYPESGYVYGNWAKSNLELPIISSSVKYSGPELLDYVKDSYDYLEVKANSVEEYIVLSRDQGLSHLVVDGGEKRSSYFNDLYYNEEKYPYLVREFDSREHGYKQFKVKVFKINYDIFDFNE